MESHQEIPSPSPPSLPRLGIRHFLLWTLCSAVYLSLVRTFSDVPEEIIAIHRISNTLYSVFVGAMFAAAIVLVTSNLRTGTPLTSAPGHWLLLVGAMTIASNLILSLVMDTGGDGDLAVRFSVRGLIDVAALSCYVLALIRTDVRRWKFVFIALILQSALELTTDLAIALANVFEVTFVANVGNVLLVVVVAVVAAIDWRHRVPRDWLHWTGVGYFVASGGIMAMWIVWLRFA